MIKTYIEDKDPDSSMSVGADMRKINLSFKLFKVIQVFMRFHGYYNL